MYELALMPAAEKDYDKLKQMKKRVNNTLDSIQANPFSSGTKAMQSQDDTFYRRVGDFRILFTLDTKEKRCTILAIKKRDKVY